MNTEHFKKKPQEPISERNEHIPSSNPARDRMIAILAIGGGFMLFLLFADWWFKR